MKSLVLFLITFITALSLNAQVISNKGNRTQTYPKVTSVNPDFLAMTQQVSTTNLENHIRWMQQYIRNCQLPAALTVQNWLVEHFENLGLETYTHHFQYQGHILAAGNVVAIQPGTEFPDQYILISSHYDHPDGPGADDNASGTAGVMEIARILSQYTFKRSIMYVPFNAEELWMVGSLPFAQKCAQDEMDILAHFNLDMIGFFPSWISPLKMYSGSSYISDRLWEYYRDVANLYIPEMPTERFTDGDSYGGDHMPFNIYEYPSLYIGDTEYHHLHPCYHKACDTIGNGVNNFQLAQGFVKATIAATVELADGWLAPQRLSAIPDDNKITVSWNQAFTTSSYKLYKNNQFLTEITDTLYVDTEVNNGTEYFYHVKGIHSGTGLESAISNRDTIAPSPPLNLSYYNGFETGFSEWRVNPGWNRLTQNPNSGSRSLSNYRTQPYSENYLTIAELQWFSIPEGTIDIKLSFYLRASIFGIFYHYGPISNSSGFVEVTKDRKVWKKLDRFNYENSWAHFQYSLNDYIGEDFVQIRFRIESSGENTRNTSYMWAFIDDVKIDIIPDKRPPRFVKAERQPDEETNVLITWENLQNSDGYNLYRDGTKLNENLLTEANYIDFATVQDKFCYRVTAFYESEESNFSEEACIHTIPPKNVKAERDVEDNTKVLITWDALESNGFNVYRDEIKINENPVTETFYTDIATPQDKFCYQVTAIYTDSESSYSNKSCIQSLGIQNITMSKLKIYPNPTSDKIHIYTGLKQPYTVTVYDLEGNNLFQQNSFIDGIFDVSNLTKGVYILALTNGNHTVTKRIVIK